MLMFVSPFYLKMSIVHIEIKDLWYFFREKQQERSDQGRRSLNEGDNVKATVGSKQRMTPAGSIGST